MIPSAYYNWETPSPFKIPCFEDFLEPVAKKKKKKKVDVDFIFFEQRAGSWRGWCELPVWPSSPVI